MVKVEGRLLYFCKYFAWKTGRSSLKTNNASDSKSQVAKRVNEAMIIDLLHDEINNKH